MCWRASSRWPASGSGDWLLCNGSLSCRQLHLFPPLPLLPCRSPAIVGVSKRWGRVCWGHRELWRELDLCARDVLQPRIDRILAPYDPATDPLLRPWEERQLSLQQRVAGWLAAKRAQLERIGGLAETVTLMDVRVTDEAHPTAQLPPSAVLPLLSPSVLRSLVLWVPGIQEEDAQMLAGFSRLTILTIQATSGSAAVFAALPRLAQLQHLSLGTRQVDVDLPALLVLTGLTRLVRLPCAWLCCWGRPGIA